MVVKEWFQKTQNDGRGTRKNEMSCVCRRKQQETEIRKIAVLKEQALGTYLSYDYHVIGTEIITRRSYVCKLIFNEH